MPLLLRNTGPSSSSLHATSGKSSGLSATRRCASFTSPVSPKYGTFSSWHALRTAFASSAKGIVAARDIAISASTEFGVPLLDLDAIPTDLEIVKIANEKLLAKHRVLPLYKRGKRLFIAVSDPTSLAAIDEIKFATGLSVEAILVEDDKLQKAVDKAVEQSDRAMTNLSDE